jgi:hypothetical protein
MAGVTDIVGRKYTRLRTADPMGVEPDHGLDDSVAGQQLPPQPNGGPSDPAVGLVDLLSDGVASSARFGAKRGATVDERFTRPDDLPVGERSLELAPAQLTRPARSAP